MQCAGYIGHKVHKNDIISDNILIDCDARLLRGLDCLLARRPPREASDVTWKKDAIFCAMCSTTGLFV